MLQPSRNAQYSLPVSSTEGDVMNTTEMILAGMENASEVDLNGEDQDLHQLFAKTGPKKEMMMGSTIRDLGNTIKEAKNFLKSRKAGDLELELDPAASEENNVNDHDLDGLGLGSSQQQLFEDGDEDGLGQMSACLENADEEDHLTTNREEQQMTSQQDEGGEEDDDVIDIDNPEQLAAKGLRRIQIDGEDEEYLMDLEGNIYDLQGNFIGQTDTNLDSSSLQQNDEGD